MFRIVCKKPPFNAKKEADSFWNALYLYMYGQ